MSAEKKFFIRFGAGVLLVLGLALLASCGNDEADARSQRGIGSTGIWSTGRCGAEPGTAFERRLPSYCEAPTVAGFTELTVNTSCTTVTLATWGIDTTARVVVFRVGHSFNGGTAAGVQKAFISFFSDAGCTQLIGQAGYVNVATYAPTGLSGVLYATTPYHYNIWTDGRSVVYANKTEVVVSGGSTLVTTLPTAFYD